MLEEEPLRHSLDLQLGTLAADRVQRLVYHLLQRRLSPRLLTQHVRVHLHHVHHVCHILARIKLSVIFAIKRVQVRQQLQFY